ncbi:uncharacterized protein TRIADDRAFT_27102, partial [Trichoplax adhaerens]
NGRFVDPWQEFRLPSLSDAWQILFNEKDESNIPSKQVVLDSILPIVTPDHNLLASPPVDKITTTWIGHSTLLTQFEDLSILTDPIFSDRCSPSQLFGPKRYRSAPCKINELPPIDAVCISHNHYDHLDYNSVVELNRRFHDQLAWFIPKGLKKWFQECHCNNIIELDWWEECNHPFHKKFKFIFVPSRHWSKRSLFDTCGSLWGGWIVTGSNHNFYFVGDTGYSDIFQLIGHSYGPFDLAAIPIGCYLPRILMKNQHVNTEEAVQIHHDIKSKNSLGIHWGTFQLSYEHYLDPLHELKRLTAQESMSGSDFFVLHHGESKIIS